MRRVECKGKYNNDIRNDKDETCSKKSYGKYETNKYKA